MGKAMILNLTLKKQWFDMIESGEKLEEYREIKLHWIRGLATCEYKFSAEQINYICQQINDGRAHLWDDLPYKFKSFTQVKFFHGYKKGRRSMTFEIREICISEGVPEWGAEPGKRYFVIKLGERIL